jgi:uncharacterized membrane protein YkvA (DUF1232 family)
MAPAKEKSIRSFRQAKQRASKILSQPERVNRLLKTSKEKLTTLELEEQDFKGILGALRTFIRMAKAFGSGRYHIPWTTILIVVAALIYFVVPMDMLPDFIPVAGYIDDFSVIMAVFKKVKSDVVAFQAWERS